jgi:drug/metabolite transporter (DMT)-like permease
LRSHPQFKAYVALGCVCFFWGTTYLGIRMALESFTPPVLIAMRYITSGGLLLLAARWRGMEIPRGRELKIACLSGILALGMGNGCLVFAELLIPSGIAGLIITISPFWMVGVEALLPGGARLHGPTILGMAIGLGGAALLLGPDLQGQTAGRPLVTGFLILQLGMASWALGSIYQKRQGVRAHPIVVGAVQQLATGLAYAPLALLLPGQEIRWSGRGVGALLYLITFGAIVGYSAYVYALEHLPVALVSLHTYVNAMVAVALGWLFYREPFGAREAWAMGILFAGVAIVKLAQARAGPPEKSAA